MRSVLSDIGVEGVQDLLTLARLGQVGTLDVDTHTRLHEQTGVFFEVTLDGETVTSRCFEADDKNGVVRLFKVDDQGRILHDLDADKAAEEIRTGTVRFVVRWPR